MLFLPSEAFAFLRRFDLLNELLFLAVVDVERNGRTRGMRREANIVRKFICGVEVFVGGDGLGDTNERKTEQTQNVYQCTSSSMMCTTV